MNKRSLAVIWALAGLVACQSAPRVETVYIYVHDDALASDDAADVTHPDVSTTDTASDVAADVAAPDIAPADTSAGCEFASAPAAGEPGAACAVAEDCESGICVEGSAGRICSTSCVSCCPHGFACAQLPGNDAVFACLPKLTALCRPCDTDSQCAGLSSGALCVRSGLQGAFCGGLCSVAADCPDGYVCSDATGSEGSAKQCVPTGDTCTCAARSIADGASTTCAIQNGLGVCPGHRKCLASGLTACDAPTPVTETCNGLDDDCDGTTDGPGSVGCTLYFADKDSDGVGGGEGACLCAASAGFPLTTGSDCNEALPSVHPGATDVCNGQDDDCDGVTDGGSVDTDQDGLADCVDGDIDGDGVANAADCSPTNASVHPGAIEVCDGLDNNCDGVTDGEFSSGCQFYLRDGDGDGFGVGGDGKCLCAGTGVFTALTGGDCNDADVAVHPEAAESCNAVDDNCDGATDPVDADGCASFWPDKDADGYGGGGAASAKCLCGAVAGYVPQAGDCDDAAFAVHPGATETCNGVDDNCDGKVDPAASAGCVTYYADTDGDGWGAGGGSVCQCGAGGGFTVIQAGDCADGDTQIHPGSAENCNGQDDNCDGATDEGLRTLYFADIDGDGFGYGVGQSLCAIQAPFSTTQGGDCDDGATDVYPGATDFCDGKDNNCDGQTDENLPATTVYADKDGDGYGDVAAPKTYCGPTPGFVLDHTDCDDAAQTVHPGAPEVLCNAADDDCAGGDSCDPATCQALTLADFESAVPDWTLGAGWSTAAWAKNASQKGLGYGNGTDYPATDATGSAASFAWTVLPGTTSLTFDFLYTPDTQEVFSNTTTRDTMTVTVGATPVLTLNPKLDFSPVWVVAQKVTVPQTWWGKTLVVKFAFVTKDDKFNHGPGFAVDNVQTTCQ